jgi:hypothetical protein
VHTGRGIRQASGCVMAQLAPVIHVVQYRGYSKRWRKAGTAVTRPLALAEKTIYCLAYAGK